MVFWSTGSVVGGTENSINESNGFPNNVNLDQFRTGSVNTPAGVSNGYYGYTYIPTINEMPNYNNNNNHQMNNNHHINGNAACDPNNNESNNNMHSRNYEVKNDVNGSNIIMKEDGHSIGQHATDTATVNAADMTPAAGCHLSVAGIRCLKRSATVAGQHVFDGNDLGLVTHMHLQGQSFGAQPYTNNSLDECIAAKRIRTSNTNATDDYSAAQYCNDFFYSLSSNGSYMQPNVQSQTMDVEMANCNDVTAQESSSLVVAASPAQEPKVQLKQSQVPPVQQQTTPTAAANASLCYQGYYARSNRDISRCMLSHMT